MSIKESSYIKLVELAAGAESATTHCVFETNRMNGFVLGLNAAIEIMNAEADCQADEIAAKYRAKMANLTCTTQENWRVGNIVPDDQWLTK